MAAVGGSVAAWVSVPLAVGAFALTVHQTLSSRPADLAVQSTGTSVATATPTAGPAKGTVRFCNFTGHHVSVIVEGPELRSDRLRTDFCTDDLEDWAALPPGEYHLEFTLIRQTPAPTPTPRWVAEVRRLKHKVTNVDITEERRLRLVLGKDDFVKVSVFNENDPASADPD